MAQQNRGSCRDEADKKVSFSRKTGYFAIIHERFSRLLHSAMLEFHIFGIRVHSASSLRTGQICLDFICISMPTFEAPSREDGIDLKAEILQSVGANN